MYDSFLLKPLRQNLIEIMDKKIGFFGRFIVEKLVFDRHREEKAEEKSVKLSIFR